MSVLDKYMTPGPKLVSWPEMCPIALSLSPKYRQRDQLK